VYSVYQQASLPWEWTETLKKDATRRESITFPRPTISRQLNMLDPFVSAFKIGSGDITWPEMLLNVASRKKPVILATGASSMTEVIDAVATMRSVNSEIGLMQCNTNYTGSLENFKHIHLNVLKAYAVMSRMWCWGFPITRPATARCWAQWRWRAPDREAFTDDNSRVGPDHPFSMSPTTWREMVDRRASWNMRWGTGQGCGGQREITVVVQRRCLRAASDLPVGTVLTRSMIDVLRPAPAHAIVPYHLDSVLGRRCEPRWRAETNCNGRCSRRPEVLATTPMRISTSAAPTRPTTRFLGKWRLRTRNLVPSTETSKVQYESLRPTGYGRSPRC